jgi:MFS family permease
MLTSFSTPFMLSSINIAMPDMARDLNINAVGLVWVSLSFLISSSVLLLPIGKVADIYGRKNFSARSACDCPYLHKTQRRRKGTEDERFDIKGSLLYAGSMVFLMLGLSAITSFLAQIAAMAGLAGLVWFFCFTNQKYPV